MASEVLYELDDDGSIAGVELEAETAHISEPFDPDQIDVITRNPTIELMMARVRRSSIDLQPDFQRRAGLWSAERQSRLIESLLLRIPLPTFYVSEDHNENWSVIDGVQRLTAITRFMEPKHSELGPLRLQSLEYLTQYNNATFETLPGYLQTRLTESEIVLHIVRHGTPDDVKFNIFARLNTGGIPLSAQEIRHALIGGKARAFLAELATSDSFLEATRRSVSPRRMADREMCLRFISFVLTSPQQYVYEDFNAFLRSAMKRLNDLSDKELVTLRDAFTRGMERSMEIFGAQAFRKPAWNHDGERTPLNPINKALFEAQAVSLAAMGVGRYRKLRARKELFVDELSDYLGEDPDFYRSISLGTGSIASVRERFSSVNLIIDRVLAA